jgi:hypothetical protein
MKSARRIGLGLCGVLLVAATVLAQSSVSSGSKTNNVTPPGRSPQYGITGVTSYEVSALEFSTFAQSDAWVDVGGTPDRYLTSGVAFEVPVHLPQGALVLSFEIEGCDTSATGELSGLFGTAAGPAGNGTLIGSFGTGVAATPGCAFFPTSVTPFTVDNKNNVYWFELTNSPGDGSTYYAAARIYYQLQVSPAPVTQTFGDVPPSDGAYQFIEAFVAAGITVGCQNPGDPPIYCPDATVTRRQMAVFFAKALGLYWPN